MQGYRLLAMLGFAMTITSSAVQAQVPLTAYVDANGFLDVHIMASQRSTS
jgi:hypothetical protein